MTEYHTDPHTVANGLHRVAADLRRITTHDLPKFSVSLNIQVSSHEMNTVEQEAARTAAVDVFLAALAPDTTARVRTSGGLYGTPPLWADVHGIDVQIFTSVASSEARELRAENERLRAQLAAQGGAQ